MYLDLTVEPAQLKDLDVFTELSVSAKADAKEPDLRSALEHWGRVDGEHVWLTISVLLREGRQDDSAWKANFDGMLQYAESAGWTRGEPDSVRAHIVRQTKD